MGWSSNAVLRSFWSLNMAFFVSFSSLLDWFICAKNAVGFSRISSTDTTLTISPTSLLSLFIALSSMSRANSLASRSISASLPASSVSRRPIDFDFKLIDNTVPPAHSFPRSTSTNLACPTSCSSSARFLAWRISSTCTSSPFLMAFSYISTWPRRAAFSRLCPELTALMALLISLSAMAICLSSSVLMRWGSRSASASGLFSPSCSSCSGLRLYAPSSAARRAFHCSSRVWSARCSAFCAVSLLDTHMASTLSSIPRSPSWNALISFAAAYWRPTASACVAFACSCASKMGLHLSSASASASVPSPDASSIRCNKPPTSLRWIAT
mmetsp:Transcript_25017/g.41877  ORF Transcript_25017/g.41877 Transcript_25017/m.41877 type:complete len:326 (-) Transcript_25017:3702-4679(-)